MNNPMEANLSTLLMSIGSTALMSLGHAENPVSKKTEVNLPMAKYNIDLLCVLENKTKGNLNPEEQTLLSHLMDDLKMKYVSASKK